ncbi:MAG TPA: sigma 54-interacting transcriptional regulator [Polyangiaceae bacterium]|nr:sigma 54-interacting transcriptional regulator [Polyangiaceae bacterium]
MAGPDDSAQLEALLQSESVGIAILDGQLRYRRVNQRLARFSSYTAEEHIGRTLEEVLGTERWERIRPLLHSAQTGAIVVGKLLDEPHLQVLIDVVPMRSEGLALLVYETTPRRDAENALAVRLQLAELISELSAAFIELPAANVDLGIEEALSVAGVALDLDRASLWHYDSVRLTLTATHEWTAQGVPPGLRGHAYALPGTDYLARRLFQGDIVVIGSIDELPSEAVALRSTLATMGSHSVAIVPLTIVGELRGALAFSQVRHARDWPSELLPTLRLASEIFANALERQRSDRELRGQLAFERSYRELSARLSAVSAEGLEPALAEALRAIGQALDFARVALVTFAQGAERLQQFQEWHADDITPFAAHLQELRLEDVRWPRGPVMAGELVLVSSNELPPDATYASRFLEGGRLTLHAVAPLTVARRTIGAVILQGTEEPAIGRIELTHRVRLLVELLGATLVRIQAEEERKHTLEELQRLKSAVEAERDFLRQEIKGEPGHRELLGQSAALRRALEAVDAVATTNAATLLLGESGVGKELFARAIHERSRRANEPLVKVNCASIPKELFESEFFGHVRGSFTGALKDRAGRFELAHRGTLFLDEVGEIPLELQAKLLRVLQEGELERVGEDRTRRVDVRIVAATNRNLARDVASGSFRQDLYYRLSVFPIRIPPLRERRDDIPLLAAHFLALSRRALGRSELEFTPEQLDALVSYDWPGNVRELQHVIDRAAILAGDGRRLVIELDLHTAAPEVVAAPIMTPSDLQELSRRSLLAALERSAWRIAGSGGAAELLGLRPSTFRDRMRALGIERRR